MCWTACSLFSNMTKFPNNVWFTGSGRKMWLAKCLWQRTDNETCHEVLPLEYASQNQPNSNKRCDIPGFLVSSDKERRVFEGCTHSFHLECLGDMDICLFCQSFLQNKARSLTETAESAILHPRKQASTKQDKQPNDVVNDQSDDNEIEWQYCWNPKGGERDYIYQWKNKILAGCLSPSTCHLVIFGTYIVILLLELRGLALIHVSYSRFRLIHNYESGSHQSHLQGKPTCSPALRSLWLLLLRILHYDWKTIIGYSKINGLYFRKI